MQIEASPLIDDIGTQLSFEDHWLPRRPYAGPTKQGPYYRMSRERALQLPYVEANPLVMRSLIITDHDGGRADEIVGLVGLPEPSYISINPHTRDGHICYVLGTPVCLGDAARRKPVNLLARIEAGLNDVLGGDVAYGGRMTKNPTHGDHLTLPGSESAIYSLKELADPLEQLRALPRYNGVTERRKKLRTSGTGRNVDLFDLVRKWAYRRVRDFDTMDTWFPICHDHAWDRNIDLIGPAYTRGPMEPGEVRQIARSVSGWTWRNIPRSFSDEQARRAKLGVEKAGSEEMARRGKIITEQGRQAIAASNRRRAVDRSAFLAALEE